MYNVHAFVLCLKPGDFVHCPRLTSQDELRLVFRCLRRLGQGVCLGSQDLNVVDRGPKRYSCVLDLRVVQRYHVRLTSSW